MKTFLNKNAYYCLLTIFTAVGTLSFVYSYLGFEDYSLMLWFSVLVTEMVLSVMKQMLRKEQLHTLVIVLLVIGIIIGITYYGNIKELYELFSQWTEMGEYTYEHFGYMTISIVLPGTVTTLLINYIMQKRVLRYGVAAAIFILLIVFSLTEFCDSKEGSVLLIMYLVIIASEIFLIWTYPGIQIANSLVFRLIPVWILLTVILAFIPYSNEPFKWKLATDIWTRISRTAESMFNSIDLFFNPERGEFSMSFAGYNDSGEIGGGITSSDDTSLYIQSPKKFSDSYYLEGSQMNYFDGNSWSYNADTESVNDTLDVTELLYSVYRMDNNRTYFEKMVIPTKYRIIYKDIYTKTLFTPLKLINIIPEDEDITYDNMGRTKLMTQAYGRDTSFEVHSAMMYMNNQYYAHWVSDQENYRYNTDNASIREKGFLQFSNEGNLLGYGVSVSSGLEADLAERAEAIRDDYLNIPESTTKRTKDLVDNLTAGYDSDIRKLNAIDRYLESYTYTRSPASIPENSDMVDYMLFESKEGYCTYYATAFAIMARCAGIPTRYMQGFLIPEKNWDESGYYVLSSNAHAWVEAYIEGIGWISFEPTPSYELLRQYDVDNSILLPGIDYTEEEQESPEYTYINGNEEKDETNKGPVSYKGEITLGIIMIICIIILFLIVLFIKFLAKHAYRRKYELTQPEDCVKLDILAIFKLLSFTGHVIRVEETLNEFFDRISKQYPELLDELNLTSDIYCSSRYGNRNITRREQETVKLLRESLYSRIKSQTKLFKRISLYLIS